MLDQSYAQKRAAPNGRKRGPLGMMSSACTCLGDCFNPQNADGWGLEAELSAEAEHALLKLASLLDAEVRMT